MINKIKVITKSIKIINLLGNIRYNPKKKRYRQSFENILLINHSNIPLYFIKTLVCISLTITYS